MQHSVHNVFRGGFDYYESPDVTPINDDQPTPQFDASIRTRLGIPASMAGRPLPPGAQMVGHGATARGAISSGVTGHWQGTEKKGVPSGIGSALGLDESDSRMLEVALGLAVVAGVWLLIMRSGRKGSRRDR